VPKWVQRKLPNLDITWREAGNQDLVIGSEVEHEGFGETDRMDAMLVDLAGGHPPLVE
jgi:hypothetical protein